MKGGRKRKISGTTVNWMRRAGSGKRKRRERRRGLDDNLFALPSPRALVCYIVLRSNMPHPPTDRGGGLVSASPPAEDIQTVALRPAASESANADQIVTKIQGPATDGTGIPADPPKALQGDTTLLDISVV